MGNLKKFSKMDKSKLNPEHYLESLLRQAAWAGLLSDSELAKIHFHCFDLIKKLTEKYCRQNSSMRVEIAERLFTSILFTISVFLKTYDCPDDAVKALQTEDITTIYKKGRKRVDQMVLDAKTLHTRVKESLIDTENVYYSATLVDGIDGFFQLYKPKISAQEIHITADYPTYLPIENLAGIEFIKRYLEYLYCENDFCSRFSAENIHYLLCGYQKDYPNLLFNLFEPVFTAAIGCVLVKTDISGLRLTAFDVERLDALFRGQTSEAAEQILLSAADKLGEYFALSEMTLFYIKSNLQKIAFEIQHALSIKALERVFLIPKYPENAPDLRCFFGERMADKLFREALWEITGCQTTESKIKTIKEMIHSLADLEDVFLYAELPEADILAVFKELSAEEIAAFTKKYLMRPEWEQEGLPSEEAGLCHCLRQYLSMLPPEQKAHIYKMAEIMQIV